MPFFTNTKWNCLLKCVSLFCHKIEDKGKKFRLHIDKVGMKHLVITSRPQPNIIIGFICQWGCSPKYWKNGFISKKADSTASNAFFTNTRSNCLLKHISLFCHGTKDKGNKFWLHIAKVGRKHLVITSRSQPNIIVHATVTQSSEKLLYRH